MNTQNISYGKYIAELVGTFIFVLLIILLISINLLPPVFIAFTLTLVVLVFGSISGAHVNPAVTISAWTLKKINWKDAIVYILAQFAGAALALLLTNAFGVEKSGSIPELSNMTIFWAELIGAFIFGASVSAVLHSKVEGAGAQALTIGLGLLFGLFVSAIISSTASILNPAVAFALGAFGWQYIVGSIVGFLIGAWVYKGIVVLNK